MHFTHLGFSIYFETISGPLEFVSGGQLYCISLSGYYVPAPRAA